MSLSFQSIVGLAIAVSLALALLAIALSPRSAARLGGARRSLLGGGVAALVLVLVCVVGVQTTTYELRLVLAEGLLEQVADREPLLAATEAAIDVARTDEFLAHAARLNRLEQPSARLVREHLELVPVRHLETDPPGHFSPCPRAAATALALEYSATTLDPPLTLGTNEHAVAHAALERVAPQLDELVLVELYRRARSDEERLQALALLRAGAPFFREWVDRELAAFAADASPALASALSETRAQRQRTVADPDATP